MNYFVSEYVLSTTAILPYILSITVILFEGYYWYLRNGKKCKLFLYVIVSAMPFLNVIVALIIAVFMLTEKFKNVYDK